MLSDPRRRAVFDKYDEKPQVPVPPADARASHGGVSTSGGGGAAFCSTRDFPASSFLGPRSGYSPFEQFVRRCALAAPVEHKLSCTLEELYKGTTKRRKISRVIVEASG